MANEIKLIEPADNVSILTPLSPFVFVDKDGVITGGSTQPMKEKGDKITSCPHCDHIHLFGFNVA